MRTSLPGAPGLEAVKDLTRDLEHCTRSGTADGVLLELNTAAAGLALTEPALARRLVSGALAWAMIRSLDRRANIVLLYGQISRHLQLEAFSEWLTDWVVEMVGSPLDPAADSMRTSELYLHLTLSGLPEATRLTPAAAALTCFQAAS